MLARVLEHWLTSASERSYEGPFVQLLLAEGHRVLFAPVHHPFEHGKDLIAIAPDNALCAYQLKGGDIDLADYSRLQSQLHSLTITGIAYPGIEPLRRPDRVFLVTNGNLTPPARDALRALNDGNRASGLPLVELVEREHLLARLLAAHGDVLPKEPADFNALLRLFLADSRKEFDVQRHSELIAAMIAAAAERGRTTHVRRALASAIVLTAVALTPASRAENHLAVAQGWLSMAVLTLRTALESALPDAAWTQTYEIARDSARVALLSLLSECAERTDLIIPDIVEGLVYPTRACLVAGWLAALVISERQLDGDGLDESRVKSVLLRELPFVKGVGECCAPHFYMLSLALEQFGDPKKAAELQFLWSALLAERNRPGGTDAVADPYHDLASALIATLDRDAAFGDETFDGQAYTLHVALYWLARRQLRRSLHALWPNVTHVHFAEFVPSEPAGYLRATDDAGELRTWAPKAPERWASLHGEARGLKEATLPALLWTRREILPYLPLLYPYRLTGPVAAALDYMLNPSLVDFEFASDTEEA